jgi:tetratricopeptide (TPR) repeat protein
MSRTPGVIASILCVLAVAVAAGQDPNEERTRVWVDSVRTHEPGQLDRAASTLTSWSNDDLQSVVARAVRLSPANFAHLVWPDDPDGFLRHAVMLHTDVALLSHEDRGYRLPPTDRTTTVVGDGERRVVRTGTVHWALARQLVDTLSEPAEDAFARQWYEATAAQLQSWSEYAELTPHLAAGLRLFDEHPRLLLYRAAMHEDYAGPRIQAAIGAASSLPAPLGGPMGPRRQSRAGPDATHAKAYELNEAETDLRKALAVDGSLAEASVRLGHVLGEKGRHDAATAALVRALAMPGLSSELQYDAWLLLGRERAAVDDSPGAADALGHAIALAPGAQSAHVALSQVARISGDRQGAVEALRPLAAEGTSDDPWWTYSRDHAPTAAALIDALRHSLDSGVAPR